MGKNRKIDKLEAAVRAMENQPQMAPPPILQAGVALAAEKEAPRETMQVRRAKLIAAHVALESLQGLDWYHDYEAIRHAQRAIETQLGRLDIRGQLGFGL